MDKSGLFKPWVIKKAQVITSSYPAEAPVAA